MIAELILSSFALAASITSFIISFIQTNKNAKIELKSKFFDTIFNEYLIKRIPLARKKIMFNSTSHKLQDTDELIEVLRSMRIDSLYFEYNDKRFYIELKKALQQLEDYITNAEDKEMSGEEQTDFLNDLQKHISLIYKIIEGQYTGKR